MNVSHTCPSRPPPDHAAARHAADAGAARTAPSYRDSPHPGLSDRSQHPGGSGHPATASHAGSAGHGPTTAERLAGAPTALERTLAGPTTAERLGGGTAATHRAPHAPAHAAPPPAEPHGPGAALRGAAHWVHDTAHHAAGAVHDRAVDLESRYRVLERGTGALGAVGGLGEMALGAVGVAAPEPVTTVAGAVLVAHGADTAVAGLRQLWTGETTSTATQALATGAARTAGFDERTAERIGFGVDLGIGMINPANGARRATASAIVEDAGRLGAGERAAARSGAEAAGAAADAGRGARLSEEAAGAAAARAPGTPPRDTVTVYRVDDANFPPRVTPEGAVPEVRTNKGKGPERALFINVDQPARAREFHDVNRHGNATITAVEVDRDFLDRLRGSAVVDTSAEAKLRPDAPLAVDPTKAPDQYGLRTAEHIQAFRDAIVPGSARIVDPADLPRLP